MLASIPVHVSTLNAPRCGPIYAASTNITQLWRGKKSFCVSALSPSSQEMFQYTFAPTVFLLTGPEKLGHASVKALSCACGGGPSRIPWRPGESGAVPVVTREFTKLFTVVALKITRTSPTSPSVKRTAHAGRYLNNE